MKKLITTIIFLTVAGFGVYHLSTQNKLTNLELEKKQIEYGSEEEKYTIIADYPVIKKGIPKAAIKNINDAIYSWVSSSADISHKEFDELAKDPVAVPDHATLSYVSQYKIINDFKFSPYINVKFETYSYTGGAHGITSFTTLVFDARNGKIVTANDMFGSEYLETISQLSLLEIKKIDPDLKTYVFAESGLKPMLDNFSTWEILPEGLRFTFGHYQIGPYTVGSPEVTIVWESLSSILKSEFIQSLKIAQEN